MSTHNSNRTLTVCVNGQEVQIKEEQIREAVMRDKEAKATIAKGLICIRNSMFWMVSKAIPFGKMATKRAIVLCKETKVAYDKYVQEQKK